MSLVILVPTKGRPENAARLARAVYETSGNAFTDLVFAVDPDETYTATYQHALRNFSSWVQLRTVEASPQRVGPILNVLAQSAAQEYDYVGFLGDDHLPRTQNWDEELVRSLNLNPGVAYGNDLLQGENLPTAGVISSDLIRGLGYMVPGVLEHLYLDDFWKALGQGVGNLVYRDDVIIEHLHPTASKSQYDATYQAANSPGQYARDSENYRGYMNTLWPEELARLKEALNLV